MVNTNQLHYVDSALGLSFVYDRQTRQQTISRRDGRRERPLVSGDGDKMGELWGLLELYAEDRPGRWGARKAIAELLSFEDWQERLGRELA